MIKSIKVASDARLGAAVNVAVAGGVAMLLSACGSSTPEAPDVYQAPQLAASVTYNGALAPADIFVSPTGADTNAGTQAAPFRTITRAAQAATPGVTVRVLPGTYTGGFQTTVSGTAEARIRFLSTSARGAKIVPPASSTTATAWDNRGSYIDIEGFEVNGSAVQAGTKWLNGIYLGGSFSTVRANYVHHIARTATCAGSGGGIGSDSYYKGTANEVVGNTVHDVGPAGCANFFGVYVNTSNSKVVNNLVFAVSDGGVRMWHDAANILVTHNTVFNAKVGVIVGGDGGYISVAPNDNTRVSNNIIYDTSSYGVQEVGSTGTRNVYANNLIYKNGGYAVMLNNGLQASATVAAEPQFTSYVRTGGGDYRPVASSPANGRALSSDSPATDILGAPRNATTGFDIGAYQHSGTITPPPPPPPPPSPDVPPKTTYNYYVSPTGSDTAAGTQAAPFKTIARASRAALPGTTIHVAAGTYPGGFQTTVSGTASGRIYYHSTSKWGAKIVPPASSTKDTAWDNRGSYVDIIGFRVDGTVSQSGTKWTHGIYNGGSYAMIRGNWVHNIATSVACTSAGGSAIGVDSYYRGIKSDVIGNLVHDIGPVGCRFVQGIYVSTSGTVKNNVVYRVAEGAIHLWHDANNVIITNNTVAASNTGIIVGGGDYYHTSGPNNNTIVANNIVYDNKMGISEQGQTGTGNRYTNNLVFQNSTYNFSLKNGLTHSGTVSAAPQFVGYTRSGTPNLHITASSPAVGKGTATNAPSTDFDGKPRNATTGYDIGAYQH